MRWSSGDRSSIEDRRGSSGFGGGGVRLGGLGLGGVLLLMVLSWATGTDFLSLLSGGGSIDPTTPGADRSAPVNASPEEEKLVDFVDAVASDTQATWARLLGGRYSKTVVVLFRNQEQSACGLADSSTGPFYCPADQKVFLDLSFFNELSRRFGAPGDFAQAYVVAHEIGHHVQNLLGTSERVERDRRTGANSASVALELQADCYAGVWGHEAAQGGHLQVGRVELDPGDAEEALRAAASIGDDRLQEMQGGRVRPDRFTHGTSAQRVEWFRRGMSTGDPRQCDTFAN